MNIADTNAFVDRGKGLIMEERKENALVVGMHVRAPIDSATADSLSECRDFRVGQIVQVAEATCTISFTPGANDSFQQRQLELPWRFVRRCRLLANAPFIYMPDASAGILLTPCDDAFHDGKYLNYYVLHNGAVRTVCERDIRVEAHAQAPDPAEQLVEYEFHPAIWKAKRDQLFESYLELQSATFGMEELVGSRILLLPHQAETIARVLSSRHCRYVLADEVGLGKTIEACVILKGLRHRNPRLKTLIVAPHTLTRQWHNELNHKFWLDFSLASAANRFEFDPEGPGILVSIEDLQQYPRLTDSLLKRHWDLLILDEGHRLHREPTRYNLAHRLSMAIENCLVLSATPILRHSAEYLSLLRLMDPQQYDAMSTGQFETMLLIQSDLRRRLAYVGRALNRDDFDEEEFHDEIDPLVDLLPDDHILPELLGAVTGLGAAQEAHSYLSENYRIESRVIRNRRASLEGRVALPERKLDDTYCYVPTSDEAEVLAELIEYTAEAAAQDSARVEIARALHYAAASSPFALRALLDVRQNCIAGRNKTSEMSASLEQIIGALPEYPGEAQRLRGLGWRLDQWIETTRAAAESCALGKPPAQDAPHRLLQVLRAVYDICVRRESKVLIFCRWSETYDFLEKILQKHYGSRKVAGFSANKSHDALQTEVDRFQSDEVCRIMLCDESGGEGRNFQAAAAIIHVDLPWMPAQIEQRIGRVDRLGRRGIVTSIVPYGQGTLEEDLFGLWHQAFALFSHSMSGMEIVLEQVQDDIMAALANDPREGLADLLDEMTERARQLRETVEEERYAEESAAQNYRRDEYARTLDGYRDGEKLKVPLLKWAEFAGMSSYPQRDRGSGAVFTIFDPKNLSLNAIKNAKFVNPPNMEEALRRSGRQSALVIRGTFDREVAVQREDMVFFAPGEPWTDALILNALHADRGQSTAILREVSNIEQDWEGLECLYSIRIDPRPLYEAGGDPVSLFHAQGYLTAPVYRVVVGLDGRLVKRSSAIWQHVQTPQPQAGDIHLGKRSGTSSPLKTFMERFSAERWQEIVHAMLAAAEAYVREEYAFTSELADEARAVFERNITGQRAAYRWLRGEPSNAEIDEYERILDLLAVGIDKPQIRLESVCFWWLKVKTPSEDQREVS
jgi:ATP-dependent helicase HepA